MSVEALVAGAVTFAFLAAVFVPLERAFPRRRQGVLRAEWGTDLAFFVGQQLVWRALVFGALVGFAGLLDGAVPGELRAAVAGLPLAAQVVLVILLCDVLVYWGHRLSHRVPALWRFHRVHHTSERLDWLAAYREHPVDGLYTMALENLPALVLGFPLEVIAGFVFFRGIWAVFIHSNVDLPLGPLKVLLGSPELHHWHHHRGRGGAKNFANLSPLMDVIFGTYEAPGRGRSADDAATPEELDDLGTSERTPRSYLGQLAFPFVELARVATAAARRRITSAQGASSLSATTSPGKRRWPSKTVRTCTSSSRTRYTIR